MFGIPSQMKSHPTKLSKEKGDHPRCVTAGLVVLLGKLPNPDPDRHPSREEGSLQSTPTDLGGVCTRIPGGGRNSRLERWGLGLKDTWYSTAGSFVFKKSP